MNTIAPMVCCRYHTDNVHTHRRQEHQPGRSQSWHGPGLRGLGEAAGVDICCARTLCQLDSERFCVWAIFQSVVHHCFHRAMLNCYIYRSISSSLDLCPAVHSGNMCVCSRAVVRIIYMCVWCRGKTLV